MTSSSLLLIDDNDDFIALVKLFLELLEQPDLILLDVKMLNLDGIAVYKMLKSEQATCSIPAVFLTAMIGMKEMVQSQVDSDVEVITKPIDVISLKNQITDLYNRYLSLKM